MKPHLIILLLIFSYNLFSQSLTEEYYNSMKPLWENVITEEMRNQVDSKTNDDYIKIYGVGFWESQAIILKKSTEERISFLKNILALNNINEYDREVTILIESGSFSEPNQKGFVIYGNEFYFFHQNPKTDYKLEKYYKYIKHLTKIDENSDRSILFFVLKNNQFDIIKKLIEDEMKDPENQNLALIISYEIINYNAKREKKLNLYYLNQYGLLD